MTKTYEKLMNLYLYIPPALALKSIVYGNLWWYWLQSSLRSDFITTAKCYANRLIARGHFADSIRMILMEAPASLDTIKRHGKTPKHNAADASNTLFFRWEYHPNGLSWQSICKSYNKHCANVSGFDWMIVAFSCPLNICDSIMISWLPNIKGSHPQQTAWYQSDPAEHLLGLSWCSGKKLPLGYTDRQLASMLMPRAIFWYANPNSIVSRALWAQERHRIFSATLELLSNYCNWL
jgi:hypothetical protein